MNFLPKVVWISLLVSALFLTQTPASRGQTAQIRHVGVLKSGAGMQIEIQTSERVMPLTQVVTDPDRLIIDFSGAVPGPQLRALTINNGLVKGVRIGRVAIKPPITRVVIDLKSPLPFQLFPSSKSVIVKLGESGTALAAAPAPERDEEPEQPVAAPARPVPPAPRIVRTNAAPEQVPAPAPAAVAGITVARWPIGSGNTQVKKVSVLKSGDATEIEIETRQQLEPAVQTVTGPDRLVIDFPQSLPGPQLRAMTVNQGEVKGVRVGLLSSKPPVKIGRAHV